MAKLYSAHRATFVLLTIANTTASITLPNTLLYLNSTISSTRDCSCGYLINASSSRPHALFTDILETDFLHIYNMTDNPCWQPQTYNVAVAADQGYYGKLATPQNVIPNPYPAPSEWGGTVGGSGANPGLGMWVSSSLVDGMVPIAEIATTRGDLLYGSYRVGMKTTAVPGTVSAFFWFRNDSQEIDMEMLSANFNASSNPIYLVMQTPQSVLNGYNAAGTSTFEAKQLPFVPTAEFHEYRFDWTTDGVAFYADGRWLDFMNWTYPTAPGYLTINHWSNGNAYWGGGPPLVPAVTNISYVKAYFNSSDPTRQAEFARACPVLDEGKICEILDQTYAPSPMDETPAFFISHGTMCGEGATTSSLTLLTSLATSTIMTDASSTVLTTMTMTSTPLSSTVGTMSTSNSFARRVSVPWVIHFGSPQIS